MIKKIFIILVFSVLIPSIEIKAQSSKLEDKIIQIINAFDAKDSVLINNFIHPDYGLMIVFRLGVFNQYEKRNNIDFNKPVAAYFPFEIDTTINFQALPTFDCESYQWSKTGLYCDTTQRDHLLSKTAISLIKYAEVNIPTETVESFKELESKSHRIVLIDNEDGELIFYLTLIGDNWYLTMLDRIASDCSS